VIPKILFIHEFPCGNPCTSKLSIQDVTSGIKEEKNASRKRKRHPGRGVVK